MKFVIPLLAILGFSVGAIASVIVQKDPRPSGGYDVLVPQGNKTMNYYYNSIDQLNQQANRQYEAYQQTENEINQAVALN